MRKVTSKTAGEWSQGAKLEHVDKDRPGLWDPEFVDMAATKLIGLQPGMTIADIGCGLGYLGEIYHKYTMPGGRYLGVDIDQVLLDMAAKRVAKADRAHLCEFTHGDAGAIPLENGTADVTMCQTLLMHVTDPDHVVREMMRVTRPGGKVVAFEPDHRGGAGFSSVYQPTLDEEMRYLRISRICLAGRKIGGYGDSSVGPKLPYIFHKAGLKAIRAKTTDRVVCLIPPYNTPEMKQNVERAKRRLSMKTWEPWRGETMRDYVAGGGDPAELEQAWAIAATREKELLAAIERGEAVTVNASHFFAVVGTVPRKVKR